MNYIVILIITTIIFIITAILFYWILNGKDLMVWVEGIRRPKESKKRVVCYMENGYMYWTFKMNDRKPLQSFLYFILFLILGYIIFLTRSSYIYLPQYDSVREWGWSVCLLLIVFMGILLSLAYNIVLGIFKSYPMEIIFEENQFTINYSRGETKSIPYYAIKDIKFDLWVPGRGRGKVFFPAFYFYNNGRYVSGRKLICKAEVLDKESYFLVSAQLKKHGLKYREPKNTMGAYERARVRKNYNRHWLE